MPDVETVCVQCKETFLFTEKEQEQFYQRNMMAPQRCLKCRSKKPPPVMMHQSFEIVCAIAENTIRSRFSQRPDELSFAVNVMKQAGRGHGSRIENGSPKFYGHI